MKAEKEILTEIVHSMPCAAAIINQEYFVIYANRAFAKLLNLPADCHSVNVRGVLSDLRLGLIPENQVLSPQEITIPRSNKKCEMFIHLLDVLENGDHHYIIYMNNQHQGKEQSLMQRTNPFITKEEIHVESLLPEFNTLIGKDTRFKMALVIAQRAAQIDLPVLIHGESGTGKEIIARAIHQSSPRNKQTMMDINCAAIPDTLVESEFFGYEKGAFTGANTNGRTGYFDQANKGTIFLDEIGDTSLMAQAKLLRVLEDGCFKRVGGSQNIKVDVRVISATNKDLAKLITENKFREDLFYRLNAVVIYLPPLRKRPKDIRLLIDHFLKSLPDKKKRDLQILPSTMDILLSYHWPGNVRELKGVVNYAANMTRGSTISPGSLPSFFFPETPASNDYDVPSTSLLRDETYNLTKVVDLFEKNFIKNVLATAGSKTEAIKTLKISRRAFYLKLHKYNLE